MKLVTCNKKQKPFQDSCFKLHELGFTLIEIIIVIALVTVTSIVLANMFISQNRIYRSQNAELNVTSAVRSSLDDVDNYVRQTNRTLSTYTNGTTSYNAGPQVLILQIQSVNSSARLIAGTFDYVVYYLNNGNLDRQVFADPSSARTSEIKRVGPSVTALTFTTNNPDYALVTEVAINLTASESTGSQTRTFSADSKAKLRNY